MQPVGQFFVTHCPNRWGPCVFQTISQLETRFVSGPYFNAEEANRSLQLYARFHLIVQEAIEVLEAVGKYETTDSNVRERFGAEDYDFFISQLKLCLFPTV